MTFKIFMRKKAIEDRFEEERLRNFETAFYIECPICGECTIMVSELMMKHKLDCVGTCGHKYRFSDKGNLEVDYPETVKKVAPKKKSTPKKKPVEKKVKSKKSSKKDD